MRNQGCPPFLGPCRRSRSPRYPSSSRAATGFALLQEGEADKGQEAEKSQEVDRGQETHTGKNAAQSAARKGSSAVGTRTGANKNLLRNAYGTRKVKKANLLRKKKAVAATAGRAGKLSCAGVEGGDLVAACGQDKKTQLEGNTCTTDGGRKGTWQNVPNAPDCEENDCVCVEAPIVQETTKDSAQSQNSD